MCKHCESSKPIGFIDLETGMLHSIYIEKRDGVHTLIQRVANRRTGVVFSETVHKISDCPFCGKLLENVLFEDCNTCHKSSAIYLSDSEMKERGLIGV